MRQRQLLARTCVAYDEFTVASHYVVPKSGKLAAAKTRHFYDVRLVETESILGPSSVGGYAGARRSPSTRVSGCGLRVAGCVCDGGGGEI